MARYWKLWGFLGSQVIGLIFGLLAYNGLAECGVVGDPTTCSAFGLSYVQLQLGINTVLGALGVYSAPKNAD